MMRGRPGSNIRLLGAALLIVLAIACGDNLGSPVVTTLTPVDTAFDPGVTPPFATLHVGDSLRFSATNGFPASAWFWRSSNPAVARADSATGWAFAISSGSAAIIATLAANPSVRAAAAVQVMP
jgi:hypothetical protein